MADDRDARIAQLEAELRQRDYALAEAEQRIDSLVVDAERRDRALAEALEQQTATAEVLRIIAASPAELPHVLEAIASVAARLTHSDGGGIQRVVDGQLHLMAAHGSLAARVRTTGYTGMPLTLGSFSGRAVLEGCTIHTPDARAAAQSDFPDSRKVIEAAGVRSQLTVPLLRNGQPIGVLAAHRFERRAFNDAEIALLETFANQAVIAIENARLFSELEQRNAELQESNCQVTEALEHQTAMSTILESIASSPTDVQHVLDAIAEAAVRLCNASASGIQQVREQHFEAVAGFGFDPRAVERFQAALRGGEYRGTPVTPRTFSGRAFLERRTIHTPDTVSAVMSEYPDSRTTLTLTGIKSHVCVPLLHRDLPIGVLIVSRYEQRAFTEGEIRLLETFAD